MKCVCMCAHACLVLFVHVSKVVTGVAAYRLSGMVVWTTNSHAHWKVGTWEQAVGDANTSLAELLAGCTPIGRILTGYCKDTDRKQ